MRPLSSIDLIKYIKIYKSKSSNEPQKCVIGVRVGVYFTLPGVGGVVRAAGISHFPLQYREIR